VDFHAGLIVSRGAKDLALGGGDGGIARDEGGSHGAEGLNTQGKGGDIEQQNVLDLSLEHSRLDGGADSHYLIGVDSLVEFFAEKLFYFFLDQGGPGLPSDQDYLVNLGRRLFGVSQCLAAGAQAFFHQVCYQLFQLGPGEGDIEMLGAAGVSGPPSAAGGPSCPA
jgi:hypothetical protein